ncbi:MAG TPA: GGDEF domain-containing protein [Rhodocyclaceae bacterium]
MIEAEPKDPAPFAGADIPKNAAATTWRWTLAALVPAVAALWLVVYLNTGPESAAALPASLFTVLAVAVTGLAAAALVSMAQVVRSYGELEDRVRELASRDSLSGAYNHVAFIDILDREFARSRRYGQPLALLIFDVDFFRRIHDGYGSLVGATALQAFARVLQAGLRNVDAVGRLGGEEFAVMLPNTPAQQALLLADRLREDAAAIVVRAQEGEDVRFTTSVGVAEMTSDDVGVEDLIRRSDAALGKAKDLGRNRAHLAET